MTQTNKPIKPEQRRTLTIHELDAVTGGSTLSSAVSQVIKNFGQALQTAARS